MTPELKKLYTRLGWSERLDGIQPLKDLRVAACKDALERAGGVQSSAAAHLGITRARLKRYLTGAVCVLGFCAWSCFGSATNILPVMPAAVTQPASTNGGVVLEWDASVDASITAGYKVYIGLTNAQPVSYDVGGATTASLGQLSVGSFYRATVTAYDSNGIESDFSNAVIFQAKVRQVVRVEQLVFEVYETINGPKVGEMTWITYTNTIPGASQKFVRLRQDLIRTQ